MPLPTRWFAVTLLVLVLATAGTALVRRTIRPDADRLVADAAATLTAGNYHAALSNARAATIAAPTSSTAQLLLARAALRLNEGLAADAALDRAEATGAKPSDLYAWRAHARLLQGDPDGALVAAGKTPDSPYATRVRARALAATGKPAEAQRTLLALAAIRPDDGAVWTDLARLRFTIGDVGGATDAAGRAMSLARRDPEALTLAGEIVRTRFGLKAALPWFTAALKRDAYYLPALIEQAATQGELGRYTAMLATSRQALASKPGDARALYLQASLAARAGRTDLARRLIQLTGGAIDGLPGALLLGGGLDFRRGDFDQAVAKWRRLVDVQPMNVAARRLLALALLRSGDPRGSLEVVRPMVLRADADSYTLRLAARGLERIGDRAGAATLLDRAVGGSAGSAPFAPDTAAGALAAAAADAPGDPTYQVGLIRALIAGGDGSAAVARAQDLAAASPGAPAARMALGDALVAAGRIEQATGAYARQADLAFDQPTLLRLVDALGRDGRGRGAATAMALYLSQNPHAYEARRILGRWQVVAGDHPAAIATLEPLRRAGSSRDAGLLADLAIAYAGTGNGVRARRYARSAYALAPMNPYVINAYAVSLEEVGDGRGARQLAAKARAVAGAPGAS
jgi:Flp pilus assembly protein TadD